ncbi:MAG: helix-turn-helix transcriptional regulator [Campylobacterales bacterium]|nr:helix-turn-helix transcriptional regulator [Campylobacterales bacterium]
MSEHENIVKRACQELGITQKELAERLDVPQPTMARWQSGEIPKMAKLALELLLENKALKEDMSILRQAHQILHKTV